mgnify:CR=1 FL=1
MCQYRTLFHDDHTGFVIKCQDCDHLHVGFGNLVVILERPAFEQFRVWLHRLELEIAPSQHPSVRSFRLPTPCEGVQWLLSAHELRELVAMLDSADTELRTQELLQLFEY